MILLSTMDDTNAIRKDVFGNCLSCTGILDIAIKTT